MTELVETGVEAPEKDAAQPGTTAPAEVKVVSEEDQRARDEAALDDKLRKVFRNAKKDRDAENGQYASKDKPKAAKVPNGDEVAAEKGAPDDKAKAETKDKPNPADKADAKDQKPEKSAEPAKPAIKRPSSWSADKDPVWESLSPEAREHVAKREQDAHKAISQLGETVKRMEPIGKLLEQHRDSFQSKGLTYDQGLSQLLAAQRALDQNPAAAIQQIARAYNVDLEQLAYGQPAQSDPMVQQLQNQVSELTRQLNDVRSGVQHRAQAEAQQKLGTIEQAIDKFAADKPDFDELASEIEMLLPVLRQTNPNATLEQLISDAYDRASWGNPAARQRRLDADNRAKEQARIEAAKKAEEEAKAAGLINVGGSPSASQSAGDLDDQLRAIVRRNRAA